MNRTFLIVALAGFASSLASTSRADDDDAQQEVKAPHRTYSLAECLALADRNHPNVWAARARLGVARGQLDEAMAAYQRALVR